MARLMNQAKLRSYRTVPKYMFCFQVLSNYAHAIELDIQNKNTKWQDCTVLKMEALKKYNFLKIKERMLQSQNDITIYRYTLFILLNMTDAINHAL